MSKRRKAQKDFQLEIVDIEANDIENISEWKPASKSEVFLLMEICVSEKNDNKGFYRFCFYVATPEGLAKAAYVEKQFIPQRALHVLTDYSWKNLNERLELIVDRCSYQNWSVSLSRLERYFEGEYEERSELGA